MLYIREQEVTLSDETNIVIQANTRPNKPYHPAPTPSDPIKVGGQIRFYLDDESAVTMVQNVDVPVVTADPPISVQNYVGAADPHTPQGMAANCMATILSAQKMLRKYLGDTLPRWATTNVLRVYPQAGTQLNAFYDRQSLKFFSGVNPVTGQTVHTCLSNDTITHEFFHAVLDSIKPMLFNSPVIEQSAAHEGFSDCGSILHAMSLDPILTLMAQQVDLSQVSTIVSEVAPDLGYALNRAAGGLRDASVPFHYTKPETLPRVAPRNVLSREIHSFSRVLSSAFYACIIAVHAKVKADTHVGTREALIVARDVMADALLQAVRSAPITIQYMSSLANAMLTAMTGSPYVGVVTNVFVAWNLVGGVQAAAAEIVDVEATDRPEVLGGQAFLVRERHNVMVLADQILAGQSDNPLYFCKVEVPREEMLFAMSDGTAEKADWSTDDEIVDQVKLGLDYIWESDLVTLPGQTEKDNHVFKVDETGLLVRKGYNSDDGYFNNATLPGAPEFGKPWKPENNSGCCSGCKGKVDPPAKPPKLGCYINERVCGSRTVRSCQVVRQKVC